MRCKSLPFSFRFGVNLNHQFRILDSVLSGEQTVVSMSTRYHVVSLLVIVIFGVQCKKDSPVVLQQVTFQMDHSIAGVPLIEDTLQYMNTAGNAYSVTRLEYYISALRLVKETGDTLAIEKVHYINAFQGANYQWTVTIPEGRYTDLLFHIGLAPEQNVSYTLPPTTENINMAWPDVMGGGYHFMKLEGRYMDGTQKQKGFAMHLGMNEWLVTPVLPIAMEVTGHSSTCLLQMDINEWFDHPHRYDFNIQGNYTMGIDSLMQQLSENGRSVFSITVNP